MFELMTYETIMERMLRRVTDANPNLDTRVGSVIWSALGPAAAELANLYIEMDAVLDETFADTASWDFLVRRCQERGLVPKEATPAVWRGQLDGEILPGARFSCGLLNFIAVEPMAAGWRLECETPGEAGNSVQGDLVPIEYIPGLTAAHLAELLIPGEDLEDIGHLRKRYYESFDSQAFGGNAADYKARVNDLDGVGGCKITPAWAGGGTVKATIIDSRYSVPSGALEQAVQAALDPPEHHAEGMGLAPIGHAVTVTGVRARQIDMTVILTLEAGYVWEDVRPYAWEAMDAYFLELAQAWEESDVLVVRISQVETRLLALGGVLDVGGTTLCGGPANVTLEADEIPVRGDLLGQEAG